MLSIIAVLIYYVMCVSLRQTFYCTYPTTSTSLRNSHSGNGLCLLLVYTHHEVMDELSVVGDISVISQ